MSLARSSKQYLGVRAILPPDLQTATRAPTSADKSYVKGTLWLNTANSTAYMWPGSGNWISLGSGTTGAIVTLTGGSGGALSPTAGNMNLLGTANQITSTGSGSTITFSLPAAITAPGSLTTTTTLASGTTLTAGTSMSATTSITAGTTITATLGNITATNGNIVKGTAGNKDVYTSVATTTTAGANSAGTVTLVGGTATISTTSVTAASKIRLTRQGVGATGANPLGLLAIGTITASTSFVINAWSSTDATALAATDVSSIFWEIVN
jgi:hypothetical protein